MSALGSGVSALQAFTKGMNILGDNTANVNTVGFKSSTVTYSSAFGDVLNRSVPTSSGQTTGSNSVTNQIGGGVQLSAISKDFKLGSIEKTGKWSDLAVNNDKGFFQVKDSINNTLYATRAGNFRVDNNGFVVTQDGYRLQGLQYSADYSEPKYGVTIDSNGKLTYTRISLSGTSTTSIGDIKAKIDWTIEQGGKGGTLSLSAEVQAAIASGSISNAQVIGSMHGINLLAFGPQGDFNIGLSDGKSCKPFQVLLMQFKDNNALIHEGKGLYDGFSAAGADIFDKTHSLPGTNGLGTIQGSSLEGSNVDLTEQFATIISTQRSFQAASRIITSSDEFLQEVVNLKR